MYPIAFAQTTFVLSVFSVSKMKQINSNCALTVQKCALCTGCALIFESNMFFDQAFACLSVALTHYKLPRFLKHILCHFCFGNRQNCSQEQPSEECECTLQLLSALGFGVIIKRKGPVARVQPGKDWGQSIDPSLALQGQLCRNTPALSSGTCLYSQTVWCLSPDSLRS